MAKLCHKAFPATVIRPKSSQILIPIQANPFSRHFHQPTLSTFCTKGTRGKLSSAQWAQWRTAAWICAQSLPSLIAPALSEDGPGEGGGLSSGAWWRSWSAHRDLTQQPQWSICIHICMQDKHHGRIQICINQIITSMSMMVIKTHWGPGPMATHSLIDLLVTPSHLIPNSHQVKRNACQKIDGEPSGQVVFCDLWTIADHGCSLINVRHTEVWEEVGPEEAIDDHIPYKQIGQHLFAHVWSDRGTEWWGEGTRRIWRWRRWCGWLRRSGKAGHGRRRRWRWGEPGSEVDVWQVVPSKSEMKSNIT